MQASGQYAGASDLLAQWPTASERRWHSVCRPLGSMLAQSTLSSRSRITLRSKAFGVLLIREHAGANDVVKAPSRQPDEEAAV